MLPLKHVLKKALAFTPIAKDNKKKASDRVDSPETVHLYIHFRRTCLHLVTTSVDDGHLLNMA